MDAVVIGSGISGLTAALYLLKAGHRVRIYEQGPDAGGVTASFRRDGYTWDLGQMLLEGLAPGELVGAILEDLGIAARVEIVRDHRAYVFPDFRLSRPDDWEGAFWRRERLTELFPDEADGIDRYYRLYRRVMQVMTLGRLAERAQGVAAAALKLRMYAALLPLLPMRSWTAQRTMDHFFRSERLQAVFTSILADFVVRTSEFPGLGVPAVNPEPAFDRSAPLELSRWCHQPSNHYVRGGVGALASAMLDEFVKRGGEIHPSRPVREIVVEDRAVRGVVCDDGERVGADWVLASGGARESLLGLVGRQKFDDAFLSRVDDLPLMESVFMVHVGIDFDPTPHQKEATCYYYGTYDIEEGVEDIQQGRYHEGRHGFVIYVPSLHSPEMAPPGHHALTVYTVAPNQLDRGNRLDGRRGLDHGSWAERKEELADKLLAEAERFVPGLREHTVVRVILTPDDFKKRTHLVHHAFGGAAPVMGKPGVPHVTPVRGLLFIGAQSESGAGVNNVMHGAWRATRHIGRR